MRDALVWTIAAVFGLLGFLHLFWAFGGVLGSGAAVPRVAGAAAFTPSRQGTVAVAFALFAAVAVVLVAGGMMGASLPEWMAKSSALVLAAVLAGRAVGDFRLVGFFKNHRDGQFSQLDTLIYSPLCLALAVGVVAIVVTQSRTA